MDHGYPNGLSKKKIPYEGQIIRVADEYDAIVSKRQYKSHIGISDTLKIIIDNTKPYEKVNQSDALAELANNVQLGRDNPVIVRKLLKVVIDDIEYEISYTINYIKDLKEELKRFAQIEKYRVARDKAKTEKNRKYYEEGMKVLFRGRENLENYSEIHNQYRTAYENKNKDLDHLYNEIKVIKKLKV